MYAELSRSQLGTKLAPHWLNRLWFPGHTAQTRNQNPRGEGAQQTRPKQTKTQRKEPQKQRANKTRPKVKKTGKGSATPASVHHAAEVDTIPSRNFVSNRRRRLTALLDHRTTHCFPRRILSSAATEPCCSRRKICRRCRHGRRHRRRPRLRQCQFNASVVVKLLTRQTPHT